MQNILSVMPCGTVVEYGFDMPRAKGVITGILISGFGHIEYRVSSYDGSDVNCHYFEAIELKVSKDSPAVTKTNVAFQNVGHQYNI